MQQPPAPAQLLDFTGKRVLVTGSGSGLGAGIALRFAEAGADLIVHYKSSLAGAIQLLAAIEKLGRKAAALQADVGRRAEVERLFAEAEALGALDVLVNNAGVYPLASLVEMRDEDW